MAYTSLAQVGKSLAGNAKILAANMMDPFVNYRFRIEIEGIEMMGFNEMSELENITDILSISEGGINSHVHKFPDGATTYKDITFFHGLSVDNTIYNWREDVIKGKISESMRSGTIKVYNQKYMRSIWHFHGAWPSALKVEDLKASGSDAVLIESMTLTVERFERIVAVDAVDMAMDTAKMIAKPFAKVAGKIGKAVKGKIDDKVDELKDKADDLKHKVTDPVVDAVHKVTDPIEDKLYADSVKAKEEKKQRKKEKKAKQKARDDAHDPRKRAAKKAKEEKAAQDQAKKEQLIAERQARKDAKS